MALFGSFVAIIAAANASADIVTSNSVDTAPVTTSDPLTDDLPLAAVSTPFRPAESLSSESAQFDFMLRRLAEADATDTMVMVDGCFHCYSIDAPESLATIPEPSAIAIPLILMLGWVLTMRQRRHLAGSTWR